MNLYEEKYNEILEWARKNKARLNGVPIEEVLPELAESDDERIINQLITLVRSAGEVLLIPTNKEELIAYLEKLKESLHISKTSKGNADSFTDGIIEVRSFQRGMEEGRRLEKQKEQKPAEWSEEDADILNCCISSIEEAKENRYAYKETDGDTSYDREIDWLKSLRPQYHGDVTMTEAYKMGLEAGKASHWKPSEEQMKALLNAEGFLRAGLQHDSAKTIAELYEQLKKL